MRSVLLLDLALFSWCLTMSTFILYLCPPSLPPWFCPCISIVIVWLSSSMKSWPSSGWWAAEASEKVPCSRPGFSLSWWWETFLHLKRALTLMVFAADSTAGYFFSSLTTGEEHYSPPVLHWPLRVTQEESFPRTLHGWHHSPGQHHCGWHRISFSEGEKGSRCCFCLLFHLITAYKPVKKRNMWNILKVLPCTVKTFLRWMSFL